MLHSMVSLTATLSQAGVPVADGSMEVNLNIASLLYSTKPYDLHVKQCEAAKLVESSVSNTFPLPSLTVGM